MPATHPNLGLALVLLGLAAVGLAATVVLLLRRRRNIGLFTLLAALIFGGAALALLLQPNVRTKQVGAPEITPDALTAAADALDRIAPGEDGLAYFELDLENGGFAYLCASRVEVQSGRVEGALYELSPEGVLTVTRTTEYVAGERRLELLPREELRRALEALDAAAWQALFPAGGGTVTVQSRGSVRDVRRFDSSGYRMLDVALTPAESAALRADAVYHCFCIRCGGEERFFLLKSGADPSNCTN